MFFFDGVYQYECLDIQISPYKENVGIAYRMRSSIGQSIIHLSPAVNTQYFD